MTTPEERLKLGLALRIISGRADLDMLRDYGNGNLILLGYDPSKFSYYGRRRPSHSELREKAEDILFEHLTKEG